jgi:hypothetical protein
VPNVTFVTLSDLKKEYRLSPKWIERLGPPDKEQPNPCYRCAGPMKLWRKGRVEEFCRLHREEYEKQWVTSEERGAKGREVADRKFDETLEYARTVLIELGAFPRDLKRSCFNHLENRSIEHGRYDDVPTVTDRKVVNCGRRWKSAEGGGRKVRHSLHD